MPRESRKRSESGVYQIMLRGINRQQIFEDDEDHNRFLVILAKYREECGCSVYGYCLMPNHAHLVLRAGRQPLETIMRRSDRREFCVPERCKVREMLRHGVSIRQAIRITGIRFGIVRKFATRPEHREPFLRLESIFSLKQRVDSRQETYRFCGLNRDYPHFHPHILTVYSPYV